MSISKPVFFSLLIFFHFFCCSRLCSSRQISRPPTYKWPYKLGSSKLISCHTLSVLKRLQVRVSWRAFWKREKKGYIFVSLFLSKPLRAFFAGRGPRFSCSDFSIYQLALGFLISVVRCRLLSVFCLKALEIKCGSLSAIAPSALWERLLLMFFLQKNFFYFLRSLF
jgi:hypothetical protein